MRARRSPVLMRYGAVGVVSVIANNAILIAGDQVGISYVVSSVTCFLLVGALAYFFHAKITFGAVRSFAGYLRYCATQIAGLGLTLLSLFVMIELLAWPMWIAAPTVSMLMVFYNFFATRWAVLFGALRQA